MHTPNKKYPPLGILAAGIAAVLVSGVAIGSFTFSSPQRDTVPASAEGAPAATAPTTAATRSARWCAGCGVIQSTRKISAADGSSANSRNHASQQGDEITVLLQDGSMRVITDANPAKWKHGERVSFIAGIDG